jgi:hypothetical protein
MFKNKTTRIVAFVGTLGASAALVGTAATSTGAYFTDREAGTVAGSTGRLQVDKNSDYSLDFGNLVPGEYQTREVGYKTTSSSNEDIWLRFPSGAAYSKFTGEKGGADHPDGGLGRYGHFVVKNDAGQQLFSSWNLQNESKGVSGCANGNGHGSNQPPVNRADTPGYCGVPEYMLLESDVPSGTQGKFTMTFGVTGRWTAQQVPVLDVPFEVVATQHGVRPDAENF